MNGSKKICNLIPAQKAEQKKGKKRTPQVAEKVLRITY